MTVLKTVCTRTETPWHSIHGHGWSRPGHQWIQFVGGHCKFHRWPWMVHHWPSMEFRKIFRTKIRSKCGSSKCTLVNASRGAGITSKAKSWSVMLSSVMLIPNLNTLNLDVIPLDVIPRTRFRRYSFRRYSRPYDLSNEIETHYCN